MSQPALSRQIRLLEDELGVSLFERQARGAQMTEVGLQVHARARQLLRDAAAFRTEVAEAAVAPSGEVVFGAPSALNGLLTAPVAAAFAIRNPGVGLTVVEGTSRAMREAVAENKADVAVFSDAEPLEPLDTSPLLTEALCAVAPAEAGLRMGRPMDVTLLADHPLILTAAPNSLRTITERALKASGRPCRPQLQVETSPLIVNLVRLGAGWSVLPYSAVHELLRHRAVSAAPLRDVTISWVVATSRERRVGPAARLLVEAIQAEMRKAVDGRHWRTALWDGR